MCTKKKNDDLNIIITSNPFDFFFGKTKDDDSKDKTNDTSESVNTKQINVKSETNVTTTISEDLNDINLKEKPSISVSQPLFEKIVVKERKVLFEDEENITSIVESLQENEILPPNVTSTKVIRRTFSS